MRVAISHNIMSHYKIAFNKYVLGRQPRTAFW